MRADRDDAPTHRRNTPRSHRRALTIGVAALAVGWLLLLAPIGPGSTGPESPGQQLARIGGPGLRAAERLESKSAPAAPAAEGAPTARLSWGETKPGAATVAPRQTSFNDDNYQPRRDINLIQPPAEQYWYGGGMGMSRYAQTEQVVRQDSWEWLSADRKRQQGRFEWVEHNGAIQYASVCRNYRRGSIAYRDCRKGAKRAFARMCNSYKPACHAANNFMP